MVPFFKLFAGGPIMPGTQPVSWVHREDAASILLSCCSSEKFSGPVNVVAPNPADMNALSSCLGRSLVRPSYLPVPEFALQLVLGEASQVVCRGQRVLPRRALNELPFEFAHPELQSALDAIFPSSARDQLRSLLSS